MFTVIHDGNSIENINKYCRETKHTGKQNDHIRSTAVDFWILSIFFPAHRLAVRLPSVWLWQVCEVKCVPAPGQKLSLLFEAWSGRIISFFNVRIIVDVEIMCFQQYKQEDYIKLRGWINQSINLVNIPTEHDHVGVTKLENNLLGHRSGGRWKTTIAWYTYNRGSVTSR